VPWRSRRRDRDLGSTDRILRDHTAHEVIDCHNCAIIPA
jgi:hypothetical protein